MKLGLHNYVQKFRLFADVIWGFLDVVCSYELDKRYITSREHLEGQVTYEKVELGSGIVSNELFQG